MLFRSPERRPWKTGRGLKRQPGSEYIPAASSFSRLTSHPRLGVSNPILDMKAPLRDDTHLHPLQPPGRSKCSINAVTRRQRAGRRPQSLAFLQNCPPWGPRKTPAGCAGQHMAGGGAGRQVGAGRRRRTRQSRKPTRCRRHREMRAFFSCMAWRGIPSPLSKHHRRLDSLYARSSLLRGPGQGGVESLT